MTDLNSLTIAELVLILDALNNEIDRQVAIPRYGRAHDMCLVRDKVQERQEYLTRTPD